MKHRLTWRNYCPVYVNAIDKQSAIIEAIRRKPAHVPPGTELHYGIVGSKATIVYVVPNSVPRTFTPTLQDYENSDVAALAEPSDSEREWDRRNGIN